MISKLELEHILGCKLTAEEYTEFSLVFMNTQAITTISQLADIYQMGGMGIIDILYSLVEERGNLISEVGDLKKERTDLMAENRKLREFREGIARAYEELKAEGNRHSNKTSNIQEVKGNGEDLLHNQRGNGEKRTLHDVNA